MKILKLFGASFLFLPIIVSCSNNSGNNKVSGMVDTIDGDAIDNNNKEDNSKQPKEEPNQPTKPLVETYKVVWHLDNIILEIDENVEKGSIPIYNGSIPTKTSDDFDYTFVGWNTDSKASAALSVLPTVEKDLDFYAIFEGSVSTKYTIKFFNQGIEITDATKKVKAGTYNINNNLYSLASPTKDSDQQYDYYFSGWSTNPDLSSIATNIYINQDTSFYAVFSSQLRKYLITWKNYDETTITTSEHRYGEVPSYLGDTPTRDNEGNIAYTFIGWSKSINGEILSPLPIITGPDTFFAVYEPREAVTKETLKLDTRILSAVGDGYTYLDYDLNEDYKSWDDLVSEGYINMNGSYISGINLDLLGKGVLQFPEDSSLIYSYNTTRNLFDNCELVDGINIPALIWQSQMMTFAKGCSSVRRVEFLAPKEGTTNANLTSISNNAFAECTSLESVIFNNPNITTIGNYAFRDCTSLKSLVLPDKLTSIGLGAFSNTTSLKEVSLPLTMTTINSEAFWESGVERLTVRSRVSFGISAFESSKLNSVTFLGENAKIVVNGHSAFKSSDLLNDFDFSKVEWNDNYSFAFSDTGFTNVDLSTTSLTFIPDYTFYGCKKLTCVKLGTNINVLGSYAFSNCKELSSVTDLSPNCEIGDSCFSDCPKLVM